MGKRDRIIGQGKKTQRRKRNRLLLLAEWIVLLLFVLAAFFLPQTIFQMQDNLLWGRQVLGEREKIDVEAIGTSYERSLRRRMLQFAEDLTAGKHFYVTSRVLPVNQEIMDVLYTDENLYQDLLLDAVNRGLLSWNVLWGEEECDIVQWKQYVIYSDDYARGVNFILWYIELEGSEGEILKLLMDAETHTVYAVKEENSFYVEMWQLGDYYSGGDRLTCFWFEGIMLWYEISTYFDAVTQEEINRYVENIEGMTAEEQKRFGQELRETGPDSLLDVYMIYYIYGSEYVYTLGPEWQPEFQEGRANVLSFPLSYDDTAFFDVVVDARDGASSLTTDLYKNVYLPPDVTIGIRQIYEMIPEFSENGGEAEP